MPWIEFLLDLFANIAGEIIIAILAVIVGLVALHYRGLASKLGVGRKTTSPDGKRTAIEANAKSISARSLVKL